MKSLWKSLVSRFGKKDSFRYEGNIEHFHVLPTKTILKQGPYGFYEVPNECNFPKKVP